MIDFKVNRKLCIDCGQCAADCLVHIIEMKGGHPSIAPENEARCLRCQHCLAVCPKGAISIFGIEPQACEPVSGQFPGADKLERLIRGRRSVRRYKQVDLDPALVRHLLEVAACAPTGKNVRRVRFTVIDQLAIMNKFRAEAMTLLAGRVAAGKLPPGMEFFADIVKAWEAGRVDVVFRGAPHLLIASAPKDCPAPEPDGLIALSYFELFAQTQGVGTVWAGLAKWLIATVLPELRSTLGIPPDHVIGYAVAFGLPQVVYARTVAHPPAEIVKVSL